MGWDTAYSIDTARAELDHLWPKRDRRSDGTIGDTDHRKAGWTSSDHNPWIVHRGTGIVRAFDIDEDGVPMEAIANYIRLLGKRRFAPLMNGGYVIYERRIAGEWTSWEWVPYYGDNPHDHHCHVSVSKTPAKFDSKISWGLAALVKPPVKPPVKPVPAPIKAGSRTVHLGSKGTDVSAVQRAVGVTADGVFGPTTKAAVIRYQKSKRLAADGIVGPATWKAILAKPAPKPAPKAVYRVVKAGDTVWDLAKAYGVSTNQIKAWNRLRDTDAIAVGQRLRVK